MAIDLSYVNSSATPVQDFQDFMGSGLNEIPKLKSLVSSIKSVFKVSDNNLQLYFIEGRRYKIEVYSTRRKNILVSSIVYIPELNQVHIYDNQANILIASERKKVILSNIPYTLDFIGAANKLKNILQSV